jgi:hypothetical protein
MGWIALLLGLAGVAAAAFFLVRLTQRTFFD